MATRRRPIKQKLMLVIIASVVVSLASMLLQLWFSMFSDGMFWKLLVTCGLVAAAAGVLLAVISDLQDDENNKKDNYLG